MIGNLADRSATLPVCARYFVMCVMLGCDGDAFVGDAGTDSSVDGQPNCNPAADPKDSLACVDDSVGIFVDATKGKDANAGTTAAPMQTITAALAKTNAQHARLYICEGTYVEDVVLDATHDGVSIYGGWKCSDWSYSGNKPVIGKTQNSFKIDSMTKPITIEDVEVDAKDGDATTPSSIAMFVNASANVALSRVKLSAGKGQTGGAGTLSSHTYPSQATLNGKPTSTSSGGAANPVTCPGGQTTTGGKGGDNGFPGDPGLPALGGGQGGASSNCGLDGAGKSGTNAPAASNAATITALGSLTATGWAATSGGNASDGSPGQGGGGGFGSGGGGGGGGGAGGCGGAGGGGGSGGGGSIALAVLTSSVTVNASTLVASVPGDGASGAAGQPGQTIYGFFGNGSPPGCTGGNAGTGGNGGAGAGGAGGISVGVLWKGSAAPITDSTTVSQITVATKGGTKGTGGQAGANDGIDGVAQAVLQAP